MLQKTGWRIKHFISNRLSKDEDDDELSPVSSIAGQRQFKTKSWIAPTHFSSGITNLRRMSISASARPSSSSSLPISATAYSSASSLCSCNSDNLDVLTPHSLSKPGASTPNILHLNTEDSSIDGDARKLRQIFPGSPSKSYISITVPYAPTAVLTKRGSMMNLLEALSLEPSDGDRTPIQETSTTRTLEEEQDWSGTVDQLMRETDQAFQAVGLALADAKAVTEAGYQSGHIAIGRMPPPRSVLGKQRRAPVARTVSVLKPKRKKFCKRTAVTRSSADLATLKMQPTANTSPRWSLAKVADGMTVVLSEKLLNRLEAQEILTPDRIRQLKLECKADDERTSSSDTMRSDSTDGGLTPVEPFHLDDLSTRLAVAGISLLTAQSPPDTDNTLTHPPVPLIPDKNAPDLTDNTVISVQGTCGYHNRDVNYASLQFHNIMFPSPPRSAQRSPSKRRVASLPTIPEIPILHSSTTIGNSQSTPLVPLSSHLLVPGAHPFSINASQREVQKRSKQHYSSRHKKSLESTPFSLTSPGFRHGSIRLCKTRRQGYNKLDFNPDIHGQDNDEINLRNNSSKSEDSLDWVAFQMAVSGGAGDYLPSGATVTSKERQAMKDDMDREIDSILEWWLELGFVDSNGVLEGIGMLEHEDSMSRKKDLLGKSENCQLPSKDGTLEWDPISLKWKRKRIKSLAFNARPDVSLLRSKHLDRGAQWSDSGNNGENRTPISLTEEVNVATAQKSDPETLMGFNLRHDLEDFLKWETENVESVIRQW